MTIDVVGAVGFSVKDYGADAQENIAPTLRAMSHTNSHANGGGQLGVVAQSLPSSAQGDFPWPQEVADPLTSNEAKTYTQEEGSHNFRTRNVVPHVVDARVDEGADEPPAYCYPDADQLGYAPGDGVLAPRAAAFAVHENQRAEVTLNVTAGTMKCAGGKPGQGYPAVLTASHPRMVVRRLTPRECERLQGFPDDWTLIPWKNKPADDCPDGPRYKALGNSMAVPVMRWIGRRIAAYVAAQENT